MFKSILEWSNNSSVCIHVTFCRNSGRSTVKAPAYLLNGLHTERLRFNSKVIWSGALFRTDWHLFFFLPSKTFPFILMLFCNQCFHRLFYQIIGEPLHGMVFPTILRIICQEGSHNMKRDCFPIMSLQTSLSQWRS